jgi:hypothetical protein
MSRGTHKRGKRNNECDKGRSCFEVGKMPDERAYSAIIETEIEKRLG